MRKILSGLTGLGPPIAWEIVGIVGDEKATGLENEAGIGAYASLAQNPVVGLGIVAKTSTDPDSAIRSMAEALTKVDKTQVLVAPSTIEDWKSGSLRSRRWTMSLLGAFALLAMLLSAAGIYGVLSFVTARRTHEMGIPAALGATRGRIIGLVVWGGTRPVLVGVSLALAGANGLTRFIESMLATKSKRNSSES